MAEIEVPTEHLHENIHHAASHGGERWMMKVALSSAIIAVFAAYCALMAGHYANEAMLEQMQASNLWSFYQAKSIKSNLIRNKNDILSALGKPTTDQEKLAGYEEEQKEIFEKAKEREHESEHHLKQHVVFSRSVTLLQIAIAVSAISALVRKKLFWFLSIALGVLSTLNLFFVK